MNTSGSHCAKFTDALLPEARHLLGCVAGLPARAWIVDPFAGTGKGVDYLRDVCGYDAYGIELEPEFIRSSFVTQGDALDLPYTDGRLDAIFTSPTYGNRMADKDMRESVAGTYMKALGHEASDGSSCHLQWGPKYRNFHEHAWIEARRVLKSGGWFLLNIKDHVRAKALQGVPAWHTECLEGLGFTDVADVIVETPGIRIGANADARVDHEHLILFRAP